MRVGERQAGWGDDSLNKVLATYDENLRLIHRSHIKIHKHNPNTGKGETRGSLKLTGKPT